MVEQGEAPSTQGESVDESLDLSRSAVERQIAGSLKACMKAHGPITPDLIGSATKRAVCQLRNYGLWRALGSSRVRISIRPPAGEPSPDCPYCEERLAVNVGLLMENEELKRRLRAREGGEDGG